MGNSAFPKAPMKAAITAGDAEQVRIILATACETAASVRNHNRSVNVRGCVEYNSIPPVPGEDNLDACRRWILAQSLNKRGDQALNLAIRSKQLHLVPILLELGASVNNQNKFGETALDVLLGAVLPGEGDILHNHFCPYSHAGHTEFVMPEMAKALIRVGAKGSSLHKLILHVLKDETQLREIGDLIPDLASEDNFRLSGLFLQLAIWFDRLNMVSYLLEKGLNPDNFWMAAFIPTIVPNTEYRRTVNIWENISNEVEGEYVVSSPDKLTGVDSSDGLQSLKLSFVQDWRADWYDGENPDAQYRAGLLVTTEGAITIIKSAHNYVTLEHVVHDVMQYLPPMCGGPDLRESPIIPYLVLAGYLFRSEEMQHLKLKYNMDFTSYLRYSRQAKSLKHLSRLCIRKHFYRNVFWSAPRLHCLPEELRNYLLINDINRCVSEE